LRRWLINFPEMTMQKKLLTVIFIPLLAALATQAAGASERHRMRAKYHAAISEQVRNSNAYAAPADMDAPSDLSDYTEGAMTSGLAGQ
jgi:hypothetical protein